MSIDDLNFPHKFNFVQLKAFNMTVYIILDLNAESYSTFDTLSYLWRIPDQYDAAIFSAKMVIYFNRLEAPITDATLTVEQMGGINSTSIQKEVDAIFASPEPFPILSMPLQNDGGGGQVTITYTVWPTPWGSVAIYSSVLLASDLIFILVFRKKE